MEDEYVYQERFVIKPLEENPELENHYLAKLIINEVQPEDAAKIFTFKVETKNHQSGIDTVLASSSYR